MVIGRDELLLSGIVVVGKEAVVGEWTEGGWIGGDVSGTLDDDRAAGGGSGTPDGAGAGAARSPGL